MQNTATTEVLICGAGACGLSLALVLARAGVAFRLIEKRETPFQGSRGKGIQPRTLEILEDLGVLGQMRAAGGPYPPARAYRDDGSWLDTPVTEPRAPCPAEPWQEPLLVPQFLSEGVLREQLAQFGRAVEYGRELLEFTQDEDGVDARLSGSVGEERIRARYLIGADGGRSFVRQALGIAFDGKTLGVRAVVADVHLRGLGREAWHRFNDSAMERQIALCPLVGTDLFQLQAPIPLEGEVDLSAAGLSAMVRARTGRADIHIDAVSWASAFSMNARLAERYRVGRVLLAGDAAHVHPPTGGQGLNTSIQDAYNLGWKLAAVLAGADHALLDSYQEERRPVAAAMLGLSTQLLEAAKRGDMRRGREVQQLDIGYPESSLALEAPPRERALQAGDRAPDAPVASSAGTATRLFALFRGSHWTLLGWHVARALMPQHAHVHVHTFGADGDLLDQHGHFADAYDLAAGDWVLIRPDGYVGAIVSSQQLPALVNYLQMVGIQSTGAQP